MTIASLPNRDVAGIGDSPDYTLASLDTTSVVKRGVPESGSLCDVRASPRAKAHGVLPPRLPKQKLTQRLDLGSLLGKCLRLCGRLVDENPQNGGEQGGQR